VEADCAIALARFARQESLRFTAPISHARSATRKAVDEVFSEIDAGSSLRAVSHASSTALTHSTAASVALSLG